MTGGAFADAIRTVVRDELQAVSVCTFARVKAVATDTQRVTVELKNDPEWADDNIPLVAPHASDGMGDVPGVTPGDEVLVVFSADDVDGMVADRGPAPDAGRDATPQHPIALPLGAYTDTDAVPDHEDGERLLAHPNGTMVRLGGREGADIRLTHPSGMEVSMDEASDPATAADASGTDSRTAPDPVAGVLRLDHPSGVGVDVGDAGVTINGGAVDGAPAGGYGYGPYGAGGYGNGGQQQGVFAHRAPTDPWRVEMAGDPNRPQEGHRHTVPGGVREIDTSTPTASGDGTTTTFTVSHGLGTTPATVDVTPRSEAASVGHWVSATTASDLTISYASAPPAGTDNLVWDVTAVGGAGGVTTMSGPPVPQRRAFEWFCARFSELANSDHPEMQAAQSFYQNWLAWLESETGATLSPTIGAGDTGTEWPYPEPAPDPADRDTF